MSNLAQLPPFIYGLHDIGGQDEMLNAQRPGWILDSVDLRVQAGADYTSLAETSLGIIVRLNHGYEPAGTIPPSNQYDSFAVRCAGYVENSPGAHIWIIGNEMNSSSERPMLANGSREIISPENYARCFAKCRAAIRNIPDHEEDWVIPGAVAPYNAESGDWVQYFLAIMSLLGNHADGIALHAYTHDYIVGQIADDRTMDPPFQNRHFEFRCYRDFLEALPDHFRGLPVFITETCPMAGWRDSDIGWVQHAYAEVHAWNNDPAHQPIQALILFRWHSLPSHPDAPSTSHTGLHDKPALLGDFRAALKPGYRVRWPSVVSIGAGDSPAWLGEPEKGKAPLLAAIAAEPVEAEPAQSETAEQLPVATADPWAARFLAHDTPVSMSAGQNLAVSLQVKNVGSQTWQKEGKSPVHAGYRWFSGTGEPQLQVEDRRTALPGDVTPDEDAAFGASLIAPQTPGAYYVRWDLIAEGLSWFADAGNPPLIVPVSVTAHPVDVSNWRAESSNNPAQVAYALDGDPRTYWTSGTPQAAGHWFRINFSAPRTIDGLQFISPGKGFPASYSLHVSVDGSSWNELLHVDGGNEHDVMAVFSPQRMQYVEIDLLAESPDPWLISEILFHPASEWTASASHNNDKAAQALDNHTDTTWSSDQPQEPGMWFQIDLGHEQVVSALRLVADASESPAGFRISAWDPSANQWDNVFEKLGNQEPVDAAFTPIQTQFINIQLLEPSAQPWVIRQVEISREMDVWLGSSD